MEKIRLTGRSSRLSLLQIDRVRKKIEAVFPGIEVKVIPRSSRGDELQDRPLHLEEGNDFFTQDIFDALAKNEADIAVHSLKDMSGTHFFGDNYFAVPERDDPRDVVIFNRNVISKISNREAIVIGTCSPRREEMATVFLKKALPQLSEGFSIVAKPIRGNVDTRLRKLNVGEYDGIILATAGLNRLLVSEADKINIPDLLNDKLIMILPLVECVPAPCQGAIVAEAHKSNQRAIEILRGINNGELLQDCINEKKTAMNFGTGCLQKFGVATIRYDQRKSLYAAGKDGDGNLFSNWYGLPTVDVEDKVVFNSAVFMGDFFQYDFLNTVGEINQPVVYVSNYKAVQTKRLADQLQTKRVWAAGTKTWYELAGRGIWVEGCADALGLESLREVLAMPLLNTDISDVAVVTNEQSEEQWKRKGWQVVTTYRLVERHNVDISEQVRKSDIFFWTSYRQFEQYKNEIRGDVIHACPAGETVEMFRQAGIEPIVFPTIKSFQQWIKSSSRSHNVA